MILITLSYVPLVFLFGWLLMSIFDFRVSIPEKVGLSLLLGFGIHSITYYLLALLFGNVELNNTILLWLELLLAYFAARIIRKGKLLPELKIDLKGLSRLHKILLLLSVLILGYTTIQSIYWPPFQPDAIYLFDFRAKQLLSGNLKLFLEGTYFYHNGFYPPFTSLIHFFFYQVGFSNPKLFYPLMLFAFYLALFGYVKRVYKSTTLGLLVASLTLFTPSILWNSFFALPNVVFMIFLTLSILYLFEKPGKETTLFKNVLLPSLLLGLSAWTRIEPFWMVPVFLFSIKSVLGKNLKHLIIFIAIFYLLANLWPSTVTSYSEGILEQIFKEAIWAIRAGSLLIEEVVQYFLVHIWKSWGFLFPLFISVVTFKILIIRKSPSLLEIATFLLASSIIFGLINTAGRFENWRELGRSVFRMAIVVIPLFWVTIITSEVWKSVKL